MPVTTYPMRSTAIASVTYDSDAETLTVDFVNGRSYDHDGVSAEEVERFVNASSPGRHYNDYIKGMY